MVNRLPRIPATGSLIMEQHVFVRKGSEGIAWTASSGDVEGSAC